jgi:hypothetical protein
MLRWLLIIFWLLLVSLNVRLFFAPGLQRPVSFYPTYISEELNLKTGKDFFSCTRVNANGELLPDSVLHAMFYYVYVSEKKEVKSVTGQAFRSFWTDSFSAFKYADSLKTMYDVLVYRTAGTAAARFSYRMFMYEPASVVFIMLHEAVHRHKSGVDSKLPYVFEEALCDVMANYYLQQLAKGTADSSWAKKYTWKLEKVYGIINQTTSGLLTKQQGHEAILAITSQSDLFVRDRYEYEINNAYLVRYSTYCRYYFLLKELLIKTGDADTFLKKVLSLKGNESTVHELLKKLLR